MGSNSKNDLAEFAKLIESYRVSENVVKKEKEKEKEKEKAKEEAKAKGKGKDGDDSALAKGT